MAATHLAAIRRPLIFLPCAEGGENQYSDLGSETADIPATRCCSVWVGGLWSYFMTQSSNCMIDAEKI